MLKIGLAFNLKSDYPHELFRNEDSAAELEDDITISLIEQALINRGYAVTLLPYRADFVDQLRTNPVDIIFNIAEGWQGRNRESIVPAILEFYNIPYTGSDPLTLGITLDKHWTKQVVASAGIPVAPGWLVTDSAQLPDDLPFPVFVKPGYEGSSKGIRHQSRINSREQLANMIAWIVEQYQQPALVEQFLPGREFTVGLLGNPAQVLPIMEVGHPAITKEQFVYCREVKANNEETLTCPAEIEPHLAKVLESMSLTVFNTLQCKDLARVDFRLDAQGIPHFLEINPLPGLSPVSLFPLQAQAGNIDFDLLIDTILTSALQRYGLTNTERKLS